MSENTNNFINNFIKKEFPIRKVRNERNKWTRAIIIPQGYVRQDKTIYPINSHTHLKLEGITSDIIETVSYMFGFNQKDVSIIVTKYIKSIKI
jgi:hypothetical protein|tara:strand:+ start:18412 stop:18690 length:279 start_codon:yes stop_codon:yes gene_type:complete